MAAPRYIPALDGLRAIAVASVIVYHGRPDTLGPSTAEHALDWIATCGWIGVDLFFVLSGFLITGILVEAKGKPRFFRNFYIRRTLRIFPLYYAVLFGVLVVLPRVLDPSYPSTQLILRHQASLWTYTMNFDIVAHGSWFFNGGWLHLSHLWSLAIEEQFYLLWPLLVFVIPRRALAPVALAFVIGAPILRGCMIGGGVSWQIVYLFTPCRLDALALGGLLAVIARDRPALVAPVGRALLAFGGAAVIAIVAIAAGHDVDDPLVQTLGFTALALLFGGVVLAATRDSRATRMLAWKPLVVIGRYTYGIYLFHAILVPFLRQHLGIEKLAGLLHSRALAIVAFDVLLFALAFAIAAASWHLFERHFLKLKDRWAPSGGGGGDQRPRSDASSR